MNYSRLVLERPVPLKKVLRVGISIKNITSQYLATFLLSYFKPPNNFGCFISNRTLRDVNNLISVVQKPITPSNLSVQQVCGLLNLMNTKDFMNAIKNSKELTNLPQKIQAEIFRDLDQNCTNQKCLRIIQCLRNDAQFAKESSKENMRILINKSIELFGHNCLLPEESTSILNFFKDIAKYHPTLFNDCFDQIKLKMALFRDLDSFKILLTAIKEYNPSSAMPESVSCCGSSSALPIYSLRHIGTLIKGFKQFALNKGMILEANKIIADLFSDGLPDYNDIQSAYMRPVSIDNAQLVNLLLDKKVNPTHLDDYLNCHLMGSTLTDTQFNDFICAIKNQKMSQLETAYYGSNNKNKGIITSKINAIIENELTHNSSYDKLIQIVEIIITGQLPLLSKTFLLERLVASIQTCSDDIYSSKLTSCFLNLIATKTDNFLAKILLDKPLSKRIFLCQNETETMRQLFLIKDNLLLFCDTDNLTHLWAIVARVFQQSSHFQIGRNLTEDQFKAFFVKKLINVTLDIIGTMSNKDEQRLNHLFDSLYYGLRQINFDNKQTVCSDCIRSHMTYKQMVKEKSGYIRLYLKELIGTYFKQPMDPLVTKL